jgi:hypothetical protein
MPKHTLYLSTETPRRGAGRRAPASLRRVDSVEKRDRALLLREEIEALEARVDQATKALAWLRRELAEKQFELSSIAGKS